MYKLWRKVSNSMRGATAIEYALLISLIAIAGMGAINMLGDMTAATFNNAASGLGGSDSGTGAGGTANGYAGGEDTPDSSE